MILLVISNHCVELGTSHFKEWTLLIISYLTEENAFDCV